MSAPATYNSALKEVTTDLHCVQQHLCDARLFDVDQMGLEETFRCLEPLLSHLDHSTIRELQGQLGVRSEGTNEQTTMKKESTLTV